MNDIFDLLWDTHTIDGLTVINGDCLEVLGAVADNSIDAIVTDPPYGLSFMGKRWDYDVPSVDIWSECLRVLKPGGHLLAFAGTRTQHRMAVRIEDAGFEIRDMIAWVYGSVFPKSLDVSKAIDKAAGVDFDAVPASGVGFMNAEGAGGYNVTKNKLVRKGESTEAARQWQGWGTALKPALEPITVARKPLIGTVAENVLTHGTGALNIDGCRIESEKATGWGGGGSRLYDGGLSRDGGEARLQTLGRWPANLIHDGGEPVGLLGEAARFFYCAKASKKDRDEGLDGFEPRRTAAMAGQTYHMLACGMWKDWKVGEDGRLHGPGYKYGLNGGDLLGWWYQMQLIPLQARQIKHLKAQLAKAYEELARMDAAANEREFDLGALPPVAAPPRLNPAQARRQFWLRVRRRQA